MQKTNSQKPRQNIFGIIIVAVALLAIIASIVKVISILNPTRPNNPQNTTSISDEWESYNYDYDYTYNAAIEMGGIYHIMIDTKAKVLLVEHTPNCSAVGCREGTFTVSTSRNGILLTDEEFKNIFIIIDANSDDKNLRRYFFSLYLSMLAKSSQDEIKRQEANDGLIGLIENYL